MARPGTARALHLAGELFAIETKTDMKHVRTRAAARILDLIGGRLPVIFDTTTNATPLIQGARCARWRSPHDAQELPDVPTYAEAGFRVRPASRRGMGCSRPRREARGREPPPTRQGAAPGRRREAAQRGHHPRAGDYRRWWRSFPRTDKYSKLIKSLNIKAD
jgi:hypothetical protein